MVEITIEGVVECNFESWKGKTYVKVLEFELLTKPSKSDFLRSHQNYQKGDSS
ncbi:MAG: hypothetical protein JRC56_01270 [Deltaproteobacteria bacterium]|nr:hypothetical protein [Deltaproteobacteria bacterium]MBW2619948.1 hypothetical protein [Deltaproteobacteria bacterium]MBW2642470.1 hypothetical protein [Deltaproteobacteria bacterium]